MLRILNKFKVSVWPCTQQKGRLLRATLSSSASKPTKSSSNYAFVNGVNLHYERAGHSPHAVICMPGALGSSVSDFGPQISGLSDKFTVISIDPRGYGKSIPPKREFPLDFYDTDAKDAAAIMQSLGFHKFSILGWSDGANSAFILAGSRPELIHKLVVWGGNAYVSEKDKIAVESLRDLKGWSDRMKATQEAIYGKDELKRLWNRWIDGYVAFYNLKQDGDICRNYLPLIKCPTFLLHGKKDAVIPSMHPHYIRENIKNIKYHEFEDGNHNIHLRYHEEFNKLVADFLLNY